MPKTDGVMVRLPDRPTSEICALLAPDCFSAADRSVTGTQRYKMLRDHLIRQTLKQK